MKTNILEKIGNNRKSGYFDHHLTDLGNAELFAKKYGNRVRYNHKTGMWFYFADQYWKVDKSGEVKRFMFECVRGMMRDVSNSQLDDDKRVKVAKFAISSESRSRITSALSLVENVLPIADSGNDWDSEKNVIMLKNGLLNLDTGKIVVGQPEYKISKVANVEFDLNAKCPRWLHFVDEIFMGNTDLVRFSQKAIGYSISGYTDEQVLFLCHGSGSNGKSVLLSVIRNLLGDYASNAPSSLLQKTYSQNTNDMAAIEGQRFVVSSEVQVTSKLNEERLKALSGGDPITARFLNHEFFTFNPIAKFWLFVNHKPRVDDDSYAFWRRIRAIPFNRIFAPNEQDHDLARKLEGETSGILNWVVEGYRLWKNEGLTPPKEVIEATSDYRSENDVLYDFLVESFKTPTDMKATEIYKKYIAWTETIGLKSNDVLSSKAFGSLMSDKFIKRRKSDGVYYFNVGSAEAECRVEDCFITNSHIDKAEDGKTKIDNNTTQGTFI